MIRKDGRGLVATLGPAKAELPLLPYDGPTFGMPDASGGVTPVAQFTVRDGRATTVQFSFLSAPGFSTFTRSAATG